MRLLISSFALICIAYLNATCAFAQGVEQYQAEPKFEPYNKHHDTHHGHKHVYPDRGAIFREVPRGSVVVNYAGLSFRFHDGVWFEPRGPAFIVVAPPIGVVVPTLPAFATGIPNGGETYLYANDVYYRARPDLGGYEVVNDPLQTAAGSDTAADAPPSSTPTQAGTPLASASTMVTALPAIAAGPVPATPTATTAVTPTIALPTASTAVMPTTAPPTESTAITPTTVPLAAPTASPTASTAITPTAAAPSVGTSSLQVSGPRGTKVFAYPRNGQSLEQQASDRYECYRFGVAQSGFDPMGSNGVPAGQTAGRQSDFDRAQAACFDGRGYTVR